MLATCHYPAATRVVLLSAFNVWWMSHQEGRQLVYVAPSKADPTQRPLPECHNPGETGPRLVCPCNLYLAKGRQEASVCGT